MDFQRLNTLLHAEGAHTATDRRVVYDRLRADVVGEDPSQRREARLSLERAIGKVEQAALTAIRSQARRPTLIVEDYVPPAKDKIAA